MTLSSLEERGKRVGDQVFASGSKPEGLKGFTPLVARKHASYTLTYKGLAEAPCE